MVIVCLPACQMWPLLKKTGVHDPAFEWLQPSIVSQEEEVTTNSLNFWGSTTLCVAMEDVYKMNDVKIGSLAGAFPLSAPPAILLAGALLPKLTMPPGMHNELPLHHLIFWDCWWKKSGDHQLRLVVNPIIYKVLYIPGGCLGFLNINSII